MANPYYSHNCNECKFLINEVENDLPIDIYYCKRNLGGSTFVFRFSDETSDYTSWRPQSLKIHKPELYEKLNKFFN